MTTTPPAITALPAAPDPNDRSTFNTRAYPWSAALPTFGTQVSAVGANVKANADEVIAATDAVIAAGLANAATNAATATAGAATATTKASEANASAIAAAASVASIAGGPVASVNGMTGVVTGIVTNTTLADGTRDASFRTISSVGSLAFDPTRLGLRITGNFSSGSNALRFQSSVSTSDPTFVSAIPAVLAESSGWVCHNGLDPDTAQTASIYVNTGFAVVESGKMGSGSFVPLKLRTGGVDRLLIDTSGNVLVTSPAGLGYGTGAGGTVTQATSKTTAVTLNKPCGQITMHNAALAAGASVVFQLNNVLLAYSDAIIINPCWGSVDGISYRVEVARITSAGYATIRVTNITAGSLSQAVELNFAIIKGAAA